MKVSRKVGRRSHSSISRRRLRNKKTKSGYRKKHTQQGGRRGRGYKRARTHKRGKRFHRGGEGNCDVVFSNFNSELSNNGNPNLTYKSTSQNNINLTYRKENNPLYTSSEFSVEVSLSKTPTSNIIKSINFTRVNNTPRIVLNFDDIGLFNFVDKIKEGKSHKVRVNLVDAQGKINSYGNYYFDYKKNSDCFEKIYSIVKNLTYPPPQSPVSGPETITAEQYQTEEQDAKDPTMLSRVREAQEAPGITA
jgi:hypothetical protein